MGALRAGRAVSLQDGDRAVFFALWTLPALAVYALVHLGQHGYLLTVLPACYLLVGRTLDRAARQRLRRVPLPPRARGALAGLALAGAFGAHVAFFTAGGPRGRAAPGCRGRRGRRG